MEMNCVNGEYFLLKPSLRKRSFAYFSIITRLECKDNSITVIIVSVGRHPSGIKSGRP